MKKLLFLMLAVFLLLYPINLSAQTQQTQTTTVEQKSMLQPQMVDLGLSVKWSNIDLGALTTQSSDELFSDTTDVSAMWGEWWRIPTKDEFEELFKNCDKTIQMEDGIARSIVLTSKKNGAHITFYFPTTIASISKPKFVAMENPKGRGQKHQIWLPYHGATAGILFLEVFDIRYKPNYKYLADALKKEGLENTKFSEWPDEIRKELNLTDTQFATDMIEYIGNYTMKDSQTKKLDSDAKMTIRPVYSAVDEE